jgi:hypothetical protein
LKVENSRRVAKSRPVCMGLEHYTRKNAQLVTSLQTSCYKSVHKLLQACHSQLVHKLLTCWTMTGCWNNLQQVCWAQQPTHRTSSSNTSCWQVVGTALLQDCCRFVTTCAFLHVYMYISRVKTHKLLQVCKQVVTSLFTSCQQVVFALLVPSCCNKFVTSCWQAWWHYQTCYKLFCSYKFDTVMI